MNKYTFTVGYPIYNKGHMIDEIVNGLVSSIDQEKYDVKYTFIFDGCTDNSKEVFEKEKVKLKNVETIDTQNLFQLKTNNILIKNFSTDFLVIFQDDMVLQDVNFLDNIIKIYEIYGDKLGIIGCRDGFGPGFSNMHGSVFSESRRIPIKSGEFMEKMMINIGPIVFTKELVKKMGAFDEVYGKGSMEEEEYSLKCGLRGLKNILLGVDLIHSKFDHKNVNKTNHTSVPVLEHSNSVNRQIFRDRWYFMARI